MTIICQRFLFTLNEHFLLRERLKKNLSDTGLVCVQVMFQLDLSWIHVSTFLPSSTSLPLSPALHLNPLLPLSVLHISSISAHPSINPAPPLPLLSSHNSSHCQSSSLCLSSPPVWAPLHCPSSSLFANICWSASVTADLSLPRAKSSSQYPTETLNH